MCKVLCLQAGSLQACLLVLILYLPTQIYSVSYAILDNASCSSGGIMAECLVFSGAAASFMYNSGASAHTLIAANQSLLITGYLNSTYSNSTNVLRDFDDLSGRASLDIGGWSSGQLVVEANAQLTLKDMVVFTGGAVSLSPPPTSAAAKLVMAMQSSTLSMQPNSAMTMDSITIVATCSIVEQCASEACALEPAAEHLQVGPNWVYIRSLSANMQNGATIRATNVNLTCASQAAVAAPCVVRLASTPQELASRLAELQRIGFNGTAYINLESDMNFGATGLLGSVSGYELILQGAANTPRPPILNMGGQPGVLRLAAPAATSSTTSVSLSTSTPLSIIRFQGLVLHNLPPGPPSTYPYGLVTAFMWSVDSPRFFNATNGALGTSNKAGGVRLELVNCTLVVPEEELRMIGIWYGMPNNKTASVPGWVREHVASESEVTSFGWYADVQYARLSGLAFSAWTGLNGLWLMNNVTIHSGRFPVYGAMLEVFGHTEACLACRVMTVMPGMVLAEKSLLPNIDVIQPPNKLSTARFAPGLAVSAGSVGPALRMLLIDNTQVDVADWQSNTVVLPKGVRALIAGDPVDRYRVHLDLQWLTSVISSETGRQEQPAAYFPFIHLDSLVILNAGPLPSDQFDAVPPAILGSVVELINLNPEERAVARNLTSMLWFFNLGPALANDSVSPDRPLLLTNVTLAAPQAEVVAIVELATSGQTSVNIPPALERLLAKAVAGSAKPQQVLLSPRYNAYTFQRLNHFQFRGYDITLVSLDDYAKYAPFLTTDSNHPVPVIPFPGTMWKPPSVPAFSGQFASPPPPTANNQAPPVIQWPIAAPAADTGGGRISESPSGFVPGAIIATCVLVALATGVCLLVRRIRRRRLQNQQGKHRAALATAATALDGVKIELMDIDGACRTTSGQHNGDAAEPLHGESVKMDLLDTAQTAAILGSCPGNRVYGPGGGGGGVVAITTTTTTTTTPSSATIAMGDRSSGRLGQGDWVLMDACGPSTVIAAPPSVGCGSGDGPRSSVRSEKEQLQVRDAPKSAPAAAGGINTHPRGSRRLVNDIWRKTGSLRMVLGPVDYGATISSHNPEGMQAGPHDHQPLSLSDYVRAEGQGDGVAAPTETALLDDMRVALAALPLSEDQLADVKIDGVLGKGSFGSVFRGSWRGLRVAIKRMIFQQVCEPGGRPGSMQEQIMKEAAINASLEHGNVVATYGFGIKPLSDATGDQPGGVKGRQSQRMMIQDWQLFLMQELCDEGSLYEALLSNRFYDPASRLPLMAQVLKICADMFAGLSYIHVRRLVHADLKPDNILLCRDDTKSSEDSSPPERTRSAGVEGDADTTGNVEQHGCPVVAKLADFGLSVPMQSDSSHVSGVKHGTPLYIAPEVVQHSRASEASDIYAAGVVMWELYHGRSAWEQLCDLVQSGLLSQPSNIAYVPGIFTFTEHHTLPEFEDLAKACLSQNKDKRPSASACVSALNNMISRLTPSSRSTAC